MLCSSDGGIWCDRYTLNAVEKWITQINENKGQVVSTPSSYLGGPKFKSQAKDQLCRLTSFMAYLGSFRKMPG